MPNEDTFVAIISSGMTGVFGIIGTRLVQAWHRRGLPRIEANESMQRMALALVDPLTARLRVADAEVDSLRTKIAELESELDKALERARKAGARAERAEHKATVFENWFEQNKIPVPKYS